MAQLMLPWNKKSGQWLTAYQVCAPVTLSCCPWRQVAVMGKTLLLYKVKNLGRTPVPVNKSRKPRLRQLEGKRWMIRGKTYKKKVIMLLSIWGEASFLRPATLSCSQQHSLSHSSHLNLPHYKNLPKSPFNICWISPLYFWFSNLHTIYRAVTFSYFFFYFFFLYFNIFTL